jgi:type IV pilus assembly protein PilM
MGLFSRSGVVGLEIDNGIIRAVEMKKKPGKPILVAAGQVVIPDTAVVDGIVNDREAVAAALDRLWSEARFGTRNVVLGMFNQSVLMRLIEFPKVPKDKLAQALTLQVGDYFPIPLSQMVMDYAVVGETKKEEESMYEVLLVATKKEQLYMNLDALNRSRLTPLAIDPSPLSLMRTLAKEKLTGTTVVVDIANGLSTILLVMEGMPRFARVMPSSLRQYTKEMAGTFGMSEQEAAVSRERTTGEGVFSKWGQNVANDIRSSISYFMKQENFSDVDRVILSGKGAKVVGLVDMLSEELSVSVEMIDPWTHVNVKDMSGLDCKLEGPNFATCVGLALRGLEVK